jgi:hypothetical protein
MIQLKESEIEAKILVCPYCGDERSQDDMGCCGESSAHYETAYMVQDDMYLESEVEIVKD